MSQHNTLSTPGEQRTIILHPSYHGVMNKATAEALLAQMEGNVYLTRYSIARDVYVLSVKSKKIRHFKLIVSSRGGQITFKIEGTKITFQNIFDLLDFYSGTQINKRCGPIGQCLERPPAEYKQCKDDNHPKSNQAEVKVIIFSF